MVLGNPIVSNDDKQVEDMDGSEFLYAAYRPLYEKLDYFIIQTSIKFSLPFIRLGYGYGLGYGLGHPSLDLALATGAIGPVVPVGVGVLPHPLLLRK